MGMGDHPLVPEPADLSPVQSPARVSLKTGRGFPAAGDASRCHARLARPGRVNQRDLTVKGNPRMRYMMS